MFPTLQTAALTTATTLVLALTAANASAQSGPPGACDCVIVPPPVVVVPPPALPRWSVGLRVGGMTLAPEDDPDAKTEYGVGGINVRYRFRPSWQLELSFDHATEQLEDGSEGERELGSATLSVLYHLRPYARWDWYLLAGLGGTADADPDLTDEQRRATQQGHVHLGAGIERRWNHFALSAELRLVGMARDEHEEETAPAAMAAPAVMEPAEPTATSGGQLTFGASYYF